MNAITVLSEDHRRLSDLVQRFRGGMEAGRERARLLEQIADELATHATIETEILYPTLLEEIKGSEDLLERRIEETDGLRKEASRYRKVQEVSPRLERGVEELIRHLDHHVDAEEQEVFRLLSQRLDEDRLERLGDELTRARRSTGA